MSTVPDQSQTGHAGVAMPELLTAAEAAEWLRTTPGAVYEAIRDGRIPPECVCKALGQRRILIRADALRKHIENSTEPPRQRVPAFSLYRSAGRKRA